MKKSLFISIILFSGLISAREFNPDNPDFNHNFCLSNRINSGTANLSYLKQKALESLVMMHSAHPELESTLGKIPASHRDYYYRLMNSVRSDGKKLYSHELNKILDLSGSCDNAEAVLMDIVRNLK